jgi:VanZ family protein
MDAALNFLPATLIVTAIIVHGSLYPYDFHAPPGGVGPVATLFGSWAVPPSSYGDFLANLLLYVPFGFFAGLTVRCGRFARILIVTLAGLLLCVSVELAQYYDVGRVDNMSDVYLNTLGSALGAIAAIVVGYPSRYLSLARIAGNPFPVLLLVAMLGYHLFPYVPTIDLHKYWVALKPLVVAPHVPPGDLLRYTALWLTTGCLIGEITGFAWSRLFVPLFMGGVFAAKVIISGLIVSPAEVIGAGLALFLWLAIGRRRRLAMVGTAAVLCLSIVVGRLEPFAFQAAGRAFGWLPFRSFLEGSLSVNTAALMEKFFLYGSLMWFAAEALCPLWLATLLVASLLFVTSTAEVYLPGRSAEITDAVMALIIGLLMMPFRRRVRSVDAEFAGRPARHHRKAPGGPSQST